MGTARPVDLEFKWHVSFGQNFPAAWVDDPRASLMYGVDPVKKLRDVRDCGDKEAEKRGLMFVGERRLGHEIQRQYIVPTFWWRLRFLVLRPRLERPRKETR